VGGMNEEQREKWDYVLNEPIAGREPTPAQLQRESDQFMDVLGKFQTGSL
jgi:hypothetical protein